MNVLNYIAKKFQVKVNRKTVHVEIPDTNRVSLAKLFNELGYQVGAEIGTYRGGYAEVLCKNIPNLKLFCIDAWQPYDGYNYISNKNEALKHYTEAQKRLKGYNVKFIKKFSTDAAKTFPDNSLDFVYIDANHEFQHVVNDISEWSKKVRKGGIVSGHDYILITRNHYLMAVPYAVSGYTKAHQIKPWFVLGRKKYIKDELRDRERSWFFVK